MNAECANKKRVAIVKSNCIDLEIRIPKQIQALKKAGYNFTLITWDRERKGNIPYNKEEYDEVRLELRAPWGINVLFFLPVWWCFVFLQLMRLKWDMVHVVNFDSLLPSIMASKLKRKTIIYEILDIYEFQTQLPLIIRTITIKIDKLSMRFVDGIIVVDEMQIEGFEAIPNKNIVIIYDSPPLYNKKVFSDNKNSLPFIIFYAGIFDKARQLNIEKIVDAIKDLTNVKLVIAGYGDLLGDIKKWTTDMPNKVEYIGKISYSEVIEIGSESNLFFILRNPIVLANKYTCGSSLFNSMICGKPILVNKGTSTANIVQKENCGIIVDANNIVEIKIAIEKLMNDRDLSQGLGDNAKNAFNEKYAWEIMEKRLISFYNNLNCI